MRNLLLIIALLAGGYPMSALAQSPTTTPGGLQLTRTQLEELLNQTEQLSAGSGRTAQQARSQAALIRQRLAEGDLQVGDRVALYVVGYPQLTDTFTVSAGRVLILPETGEIPIAGVLRSELTAHLQTNIGRFIREPVVRAQPLIRLDIRGAVGRPGFYTLAADMLLSDVIMAAGGPSARSGLDKMRIVRGPSVVWSGSELSSALVEGLTLDQLSVRAGDRIEVPEGRSTLETVRNVFAVVSGVASVVWLIQRARN
jgi:protein involved in polysaccharide export with SLBB domain